MLLQADSECWVIVHHDRNAPPAEFAELKRLYGSNERVLLIEDRTRCGCGQFAWSMERSVPCTCLPRPEKPIANDGIDFIESHDESWKAG